MNEFIPVYLLDVKRAIDELESYFVDYPSMQFTLFEKDFC